MKVNFDNNYNMNFGQLFLHQGMKLSRMHVYNNQIINFIKPELEAEAKDVDIHIWFKNVFQQGFDIAVGDVVKSPLKRFLGLYGETIVKYVRPNDCFAISAVEVVLDKVRDAKKQFIELRERIQ